ncbi:hypothetical protein [Nonomuraea rhizosphaerae]|uniref:hypothetical protein n=1 Tax=Nonomuraea rhizosphaerae TaxID=2665663 RepID=UPI001C5FC216|nr:hypothetical protein [Nonomuraea rhizosphaerae]
MAKLDITNVPRELDQLIKASPNRRRRHILENVRRHYLLELTGRTEQILRPDMTVENPVYYLNLDGASRTLRGREEVRAFYKEVEGVVFACTETAHAVSDSGYWFESWFNFYLPGSALGLDSATWHLKRQWITMRWPYDERGLLVGERLYEHADLGEVVEIDPAEVVSFEEARRVLDPLIRPLPTYSGL